METLRDAAIELLRGQTMFIALRKRNLDMESPEYKKQIGDIMGTITKALEILTGYVKQFDTMLKGKLPQEAKERITAARSFLKNVIDQVVFDFTRSQNAEVLAEAAKNIMTAKNEYWDKARAELIEAELQPAQKEALKRAA